MLSNCSECKYFHAEGCGVNPHYREKTKALRIKLTPSELAYFVEDLPSCAEWEQAGSDRLLQYQTQCLQPLTVLETNFASTVTAPESTQTVSEESCQSSIADENGSFRMIEVHSSNIRAIGWLAGVCQVEFHSGRKCQYSEVPEWSYLNFLKASSKGCFLREVLNTSYRSKRL